VRRDRLAVDLEQLNCGDGRVVGGVEDRAVRAADSDRADKRLGDICVVDAVQPLVQRPVATPVHRLGDVRIAVAVNERQAHGPQRQPVRTVRFTQRPLGGGVALGVRTLDCGWIGHVADRRLDPVDAKRCETARTLSGDRAMTRIPWPTVARAAIVCDPCAPTSPFLRCPGGAILTLPRL
jgi:hypothetical protein